MGKMGTKKTKTKSEPEDQEEAEKETHDEVLRRQRLVHQILSQLGRPPNFNHIQAIPLWGDRYRVNLYVNAEASRQSILEAPQISDSFFVVASIEGKLVSPPKLKRRY